MEDNSETAIKQDAAVENDDGVVTILDYLVSKVFSVINSGHLLQLKVSHFPNHET
jgi:hypothetical protein